MNSDQRSAPLQSPGPNDLFILDIDSTLVTTHQRNQAILEAFIRDHEQEFVEDCQALTQAHCQLWDYGIESALKRIQFQPQNSQTRDSLMKYWRQHFFANHFLHNDRPTEGAISWTQSLQDKGVSFLYLTARHKISMWEGTLKTMTDLGFPISESILFLKENLDQSDAEYKSDLIAEVIKIHPKKNIWLIDNEPVVLNQMDQDHPKVGLIWFESCHSGKMSPPAGVMKINHFNF